jgi:predicted glycogen debranching enzyme
MTTQHEWLETDGLGGFASGTAAGTRTRRYHALLLTSEHGPAGRRVLVNGFDAFVTTPAGTFALSSQHYQPGVTAPDGAQRIRSFMAEPWPRWVFDLGGGTLVSQEIFVPKGLQATVVIWRLLTTKPGVTLHARPFLSGRDYHSTHHENDAFRFEARRDGARVTWHPYEGVPAIHVLANARYDHEPLWYRNFLYTEERARGLDDTEDLATPGTFTWDLSQQEAVWIFAHESALPSLELEPHRVTELAATLAAHEQRRRAAFSTPLHRAADAYLVSRGAEQTIVAGYPWFTDWGRDTFIALRGLCLATGRLADARGILLSWAGAISEGMVPNRFPDHGEQPEFNSVDASLWYIVAVHEFLAETTRTNFTLAKGERDFLRRAVETIVEGFAGGTRHRIKLDDDGLLSAGEPGVQLTWMDAKVGDWVVTPRIGKPVEVQALWLNALWIAAQFSAAKWQPLLERGLASFRARFWNESAGCLYDVIDVDHERGHVDATIRPNQIFAVGGLPFVIIEGSQAQRVLACVERHLLTPLGLRSLSPEDPAYRGRYEGGVTDRDGSYHQGPVWPWLMGAFVEAWLNLNGANASTRLRARERFLKPLFQHFGTAGLGHVSEIADGAPPHAPRGCPWQAWSVSELLRLAAVVLAEPTPPPKQDAGVPSDAHEARSCFRVTQFFRCP